MGCSTCETAYDAIEFAQFLLDKNDVVEAASSDARTAVIAHSLFSIAVSLRHVVIALEKIVDQGPR